MSNREGEGMGRMEKGKEPVVKGRSTELLESAEKELFETQLQLKAKVYMYMHMYQYMVHVPYIHVHSLCMYMCVHV